MNSKKSGNPIPKDSGTPAIRHKPEGSIPSTEPAALLDSTTLPETATLPEPAQTLEPALSLEWSVHPSACRPVRSAIAVMLVAMMGGALFRLTGTLLYSLIAVIVCLLSLVPFFMRTEYRMDDRGVTMRRAGRSRRLEWSRIRTVTAGTTSIYISPESSRSIRESRGILLLCPQNLDRVAELIVRRMAPGNPPDSGRESLDVEAGKIISNDMKKE